MSLYVAAYDISDDRRRDRVARVLLNYGHRIQQSVFELWLEPEETTMLRREVGARVAADDHFHLFPIDERGSRRSCAWQRGLDEFDPVMLL